MPPQWYWNKDGTERGPLSSNHLRNLAAKGRLLPSDQVRREDLNDWISAGSIKGLFAEPSSKRPAVPPPLPDESLQSATLSENLDDEDKAPTGFRSRIPAFLHTWPAALIGLTCCFPIGHFLVWTHPRWTVAQKAIWSGVWVSVMLWGRYSPTMQEAREEARRDSEIQQKLAKVSKTKSDDGADASGGGKKTYKVSKGVFKGSIVVEVAEIVAEEIDIQNLEYTDRGINLVIKWKNSTGGQRNSPWRFSAFDENKTKVNASYLAIPGTINVGETFRARIILSKEELDATSRILIHR